MTTTPDTLIALDAGTSTVRAALYRGGRLVAQARRPLRLVFPAPGRAEQDARELHESAEEVLAETSAFLDAGETASIGIANQRSTVVLWDEQTGRALGPALSWRDGRATAEAAEMARAVPDLATRTGLPPSAHYGAPKIAWALRHWPEARAAADSGRLRVGPVSTWIAWKLSRGSCFAVDPTNAQRMLLMDLRALAWDPDLLLASGIPGSALPEIRPTDGMFGEFHAGGHRLRVQAMIGDQQAVLAGMGGGRDDGVACVQLGTGGFVLQDVGETSVIVPGLLAGLARADANRPRRYLVEGTVNSAGSALDRLRDLGILGAGEDVDELCAAADNPVTVVPAWAGLGAPWWSSGARAALMGWDESTSRADIVAGTVQGVALLVADILDVMAAAQRKVSSLDLSGSVSKIAAMAQAVADASWLPVRVLDNPEATLEGVATLLAEATGAEPPRLSLEPPREVEPRADLSAARAAFAEARSAAMRLARAGPR